MSPAVKSKSKEKSSVKDQKVSSKHVLTNGGTSASAYNPVSGTFHMLDSVTVSSGASLHNGRFDIDDNSGSFATNTDCDSLSNNGSCSGESEDQKDKNGIGRSENPPGSVGVNDRREKIRHKNERKHQRQKEKRAQELRDRCTGYLMSRKLEALNQQLVAMGFSSDRATMALILNEGRVEDSVNWLIEGGEAAVNEDQSTAGNLKIDISEELAHIAGMEIKFKCPRAEVERTIVGCEGDLEKAAEILRSRRQEFSPSNGEDKMASSVTKTTKDISGNGNKQSAAPAQAPSQRGNLIQVKNTSTVPVSYHQRREEKDFNYAKGKTQATPSRVVTSEGMIKTIIPSRRVQAKGDWQRPPSPAEKKVPVPISWPSSTPAPSVSYPVINNGQVGNSSKTVPAETRHRTGVSDIKAVQVTAREPVVVMQRPPSSYTTQLPVASVGVSSASASSLILPSSGWNGNYVDSSLPSNFQYNNGSAGTDHLKGVTVGKVPVGFSAKSFADIQGHFQPSYLSSPMDSVTAGWSSGQIGFGSSDLSMPSSSLLSPLDESNTPSGHFAVWGPTVTVPPIDWSMGSMVNCDYTNIDWSVAPSPSPSSPQDSSLIGFSRGFPSMGKLGDNVNCEGSLQHLSVASSPSDDNSGCYDIWLGSKGRDNNTGIGLQEKTVNESGNATSSVGLREWTNPFAGKDLFSLPRQLVPTPPL